MDNFLGQIARALWDKYGDEISSLNIIFPSRRARLFFSDELTKIVGRPVWQPVWMSLDEVVEDISGIRSGDHVRLVVELYKVYSRRHSEPFDSFYFWGEMLLADFDQIDKYMIDADMLFANMADIKQLEAEMEYLDEEQRRVIARFWSSFGERDNYSEQQRRFMEIWMTLADIYHEFRAELTAKGLAYSGMAYRSAAERVCNGEAFTGERRRYVIAGFNALSECEKKIFDYLAREHDVEFFWDYDRYYVDNQQQEAGLFLRENLKRFPEQTQLPYDNAKFSQKKNITVVAAPSDSMQCKYVADFLNIIEGAGKETAIVLTDENLLAPVLHAIPPTVGAVNVTMGYPLRLTLEYSFVERLIGLQSRRRVRGGRTAFYHEDVQGLLRHSFVLEQLSNEAVELSKKIAERQQIYVVPDELGGLASSIFTPAGDGWQALVEYIKTAVSQVVIAERNDAQRLEFFSVIVENIDKLRNSLEGGVELSAATFASLLRKLLQAERVAYEGEPLEGVQVMGILETRNLDFKNVLLLSATDDTFPGNRAVASSFVPHNLRVAYGLPTPRHHEGVYAYYFYRLLQRTDNVHIAYSARADERSSGEQSRYIYQLEYESPHDVVRREIAVNVSVTTRQTIEVAKSEEVSLRLERYRGGGATISPTAFYNFVQCPLKFYYHSIARLRAEETIDEDIGAPMFGTILHKAMELLYSRLGGDVTLASAASAFSNAMVEAAVDRAIVKEYFKGDAVAAEERSGRLLLARDIVVKYVSTCILPFDKRQGGVVTGELERPVRATFEGVEFAGVADRVDRLPDGRARIVDYKTGAPNLEFKGVEALFSESAADRNAAALQTLLYAMMFHRETGLDVQPALYYVRTMRAEDYSPLLTDRSTGEEIVSYLAVKERFESLLADKLGELFDIERPFVQCADETTCGFCDFNVICRR